MGAYVGAVLDAGAGEERVGMMYLQGFDDFVTKEVRDHYSIFVNCTGNTIRTHASLGLGSSPKSNGTRRWRSGPRSTGPSPALQRGLPTMSAKPTTHPTNTL